jgi:PhnB protein
MFDGQCRAAFTRYHQLLGGELRMLTFGDSPMAAEVEPRWHDRIVHVTLQVGDFELTGADVLPRDYAIPQGFSVLLTFGDSVRGEHVFNELARGGEIRFPFQQTFWSPGFGVLVDEFGVPWEVSCEQSSSA